MKPAAGVDAKSRRGDLFYAAIIAAALVIAWLGSRHLRQESDAPFDASRLDHVFVDVELPRIDFKELPFGFFRSPAGYSPMPARVRYADEIEVALVENRNRLLLEASSPQTGRN